MMMMNYCGVACLGVAWRGVAQKLFFILIIIASGCNVFYFSLANSNILDIDAVGNNDMIDHDDSTSTNTSSILFQIEVDVFDKKLKNWQVKNITMFTDDDPYIWIQETCTKFDFYIAACNVITERVACYHSDAILLFDFNLSSSWSDSDSCSDSEGGGMCILEQNKLGQLYNNTNTKRVFEWGMGQSSMLANFFHINTLISVDSDSNYVKQTQELVNNPNYLFIHANIGDTVDWGYPKMENNQKSLWPDYSLQVDQFHEPFDIYLIDGRFRVACVCKAFLHAGIGSVSESESWKKNKSLIIIHDFHKRSQYHDLLEIATIVESIFELVVLKRKKNIEDSKILDLWNKYKFVAD